MKRAILAIIIPILFLAFPDTVETVCLTISDVFMSIMNPLLEYIGKIAQG